MPYTMTRGASNKPTIYTLKHGFDTRIVERVTKKGFWVLPAVVFLALSLATLTSNQWYGRSDNKDTSPPKSSVSSSASEPTDSSAQPNDSRAATWSTAATPSAAKPIGGDVAASAPQTTTPITNVIGGRGGDSTLNGSSTSTPILAQPTPTIPPQPVVTTPETPPIILEPAPTSPTPEQDLLCTPDLLGVIPSTCL